jgi:hypothetical protein
MVSLGPNIQGLDMKSMYDFSELRKPQKEKTYPKNSLMYVIDTHPDFTIFKMLVKRAKLDDKFCEGIDPSNCDSSFLINSLSNDAYTVFIPSDAHLKTKYKPEFFQEMDIGMARRIVLISTMKRKMGQEFFQTRQSGNFATLDKSNSMSIRTYTYPSGELQSVINDFITIIHWNQPASNGIIHVIDDFLIPDCNST